MIKFSEQPGIFFTWFIYYLFSGGQSSFTGSAGIRASKGSVQVFIPTQWQGELTITLHRLCYACTLVRMTVGGKWRRWMLTARSVHSSTRTERRNATSHDGWRVFSVTGLQPPHLSPTLQSHSWIHFISYLFSQQAASTVTRQLEFSSCLADVKKKNKVNK